MNDAPAVASPIADVNVNEDAADQIIDLSGIFADIDTAVLTLSAVSSDGSLVNTTVNGTDLTLSFSADQNGSATVTVTADDGEFTVSDTFNVNVAAVNDAPTVTAPISDVNVSEDAADQIIDLSGVFADIDTATLTLSAVSSDGSLVNTSVDGTDLTLSFVADQSGSATVTVTADDGEFTVSDTFNVNVAAVNDAPTVTAPIADVNVNEDAADQIIDLTGVFADIDTATLTLSAVSSDGSLVNTSVNGTDLTLSFAAGQSGSASVTVTADDGEFNVGDTFTVTVIAATGGPEVTNLSGPDFAVVGKAILFEATSTGAIVQSWQVLDVAGDVVASGSGTSFDFTPESTGEFTVVVTAEDGAGGSDSEQLSLTVSQLGVVGDDLVISGTDSNDRIGVYSDAQGDLHVYMNGRYRGEFQDVGGEIIVCAGDGHDRVYVSRHVTHDTQIDGGTGRDWIIGGSGNDVIDGGDGRDWIHGRTGNDLIHGNDGHDVIFGGLGDDELHGDAGNDWLYGGLGDDTLIGGTGNDWLFGGAGNDLLEGAEGNDKLFGGKGDDVLNGGEGNDLMIGGRGNDTINGGPGHDWWC